MKEYLRSLGEHDFYSDFLVYMQVFILFSIIVPSLFVVLALALLKGMYCILTAH